MKAYHAALNAFNVETVEQYFAEQAEYCSPGLKENLFGRAAIMTAFRVYFLNHPDQIAEDDRIELTGQNEVTSHWRLSVPSAKVDRSGTEVVQFNGDGKIIRVEVHDVSQS